MQFLEALERAREKCRNLIAQAAMQHRTDGHKVNMEVAPLRADGAVCFAPDGLQLPLRLDFAYADEADVWHTENADSLTIRFGTTAYAERDRMKIATHEIAWDYLKISAFPLPSGDWESLRESFLRWFDAAEVNVPDADGLYGVVHFISDPEISDDGFQFFVDLGSSPIGALSDLLDCLASMQITSCTFGSNND